MGILNNSTKNENIDNNINTSYCDIANGFFPIDQNDSNCYNNETISKGYYLDTNIIPILWKKCFEKCETCFSQGNNTNMNCLSCKTNNNSEVNLIDYNCINSCPINTFITLEGDCVLNCPNGTYQFSLNNSCLELCPDNYIISDNQCMLKSLDKDKTVDEFKNQILNDITSYINSTQVINGSNFLAVVLSSDDINPEEQLKKGISAFDLGNCTNEIKEYYNISKEENLIVLNIETKNDENQINDSKNNDDKSFNLGKNTQIELYDYSGRKLNLSVCKEDIKVMKYLGDIEELDINSAKILSEQGLDVFNLNDKFFNDICHNFNSLDGKDIILTDRRKDIFQNATFCQNGCTYVGMNFSLMTANCICKSNSLQENENGKNENNKEIDSINYKDLADSFISNLLNFNFKVLRCHNLVFDKKILFNNIGFYCLFLMFFLQIIFLLIYLIKKLKSLKNNLLGTNHKHWKHKEKKMNKDNINIIKNKNINNSNNLILIDNPKANPLSKYKNEIRSSKKNLNNNKNVNIKSSL